MITEKARLHMLKILRERRQQLKETIDEVARGYGVQLLTEYQRQQARESAEAVLELVDVDRDIQELEAVGRGFTL